MGMDNVTKFDHLEATFNVNKSVTSEIYRYNSSNHFTMAFPPIYIKWVTNNFWRLSSNPGMDTSCP